MRNPHKDYSRLLQTFTKQEEIDEINGMIHKLATDKCEANIQGQRYDRIKELKQTENNLAKKLHA